MVYNVNFPNTVNTSNLISLSSIQIPLYTKTPNTIPVSGTIGNIICIQDSATHGGKSIDGMIAFWDFSNSRWSYISDNLAV
jgi:hypothetical protein